MAVRGERGPLGSHAHVGKKRGGAGTAVINERQRTLCGIYAIFGICHVEHGSFGRTIIRADHIRSRSGGVVNLLPADARAVVRHRGLFFWRWLAASTFSLCLLRGTRALPLLLWRLLRLRHRDLGSGRPLL